MSDEHQMTHEGGQEDWRETLRIANERYRANQERKEREKEDRETGRTVPEWKRYDSGE